MQFSLFGAAAATPTLADLDGVLLAGGHWVRTPADAAGAGARLSVVVADDWRAAALAEAFAALGVGDEQAVVDTPGGAAVRTAVSTRLLAAAQRWTKGAREVAPEDLQLSAGGLRLWAVASGRRDDAGYLLGTVAADDDALHRVAGAQLARLGVAAVSIGARGGPGWRVTSVRRLRRLVELLGPPPAGGDQQWPPAGVA